ncbi:MAG: CAP domain-containing protein [Anaerolineales bacterium]
MRKKLVPLVAMLLVLGLILSYDIVAAKPSAVPALQSSANDLIQEVNALRIANGLPPYSVNPILTGTAQAQADYMAAIGSVTHSGPGGVQLTQRLLNAGYPLAGDLSLGGFRAENITGGNKTAAQAVQGWTGDAPHLNTMLSPELTEMGAGVAKVGDRYYMVIDCARPTTDGQPQVYTPGTGAPVIGTSAPSDFIVPIKKSTPDSEGMVYHEVQYGQTLWAIAIEYDVKIDDIRALNSLGPTTEIYQGEKLLVRKDTLSAPITATNVLSITLTGSFPVPTATSFRTATPTRTETPTVIMTVTEGGVANNSKTGTLIGIVFIAILFAGIFSWISSRRGA